MNTIVGVLVSGILVLIATLLGIFIEHNLHAKRKRKQLFKALYDEIKLNRLLAEKTFNGLNKNQIIYASLYTQCYDQVRASGELFTLRDDFKLKMMGTYDLIYKYNRDDDYKSGHKDLLKEIIDGLEIIERKMPMHLAFLYRSEKRMHSLEDNITEEVVISIIGASIFSCGIAQTITLYLHAYIGSKPYESSSGASLCDALYNQFRIYAPIGIIIFLEALFFTFLLHYLFWPIMKNRNHPPRIIDLIFYLLMIVCISAVPWPIQRLMTAHFIENGNWNVHLPPLLFWILPTSIVLFIGYKLKRSSQS